MYHLTIFLTGPVKDEMGGKTNKIKTEISQKNFKVIDRFKNGR